MKLKPMKISSTHTAAAIAVTMLALAACDRVTTEEVRAEGRQAGRQVEDAADRTTRALADMGERLGPKVAAATEKTKEQLAVAGDKTRDALQGDGAITASIKASMLKDPDLSVLKIDVDTNDGVVVLNGLARDAAAKARASKIAEGTKGVREVRNHLTVKQG